MFQNKIEVLLKTHETENIISEIMVIFKFESYFYLP